MIRLSSPKTILLYPAIVDWPHANWHALKKCQCVTCLLDATIIPTLNSSDCWRNTTTLSARKTIAEKIREKQATADFQGNYRHYVDRRSQSELDLSPVQFRKTINRSKISDQKTEMVKEIKSIVNSLRKYWPLTDRTIHYGMLNNPPLRNTARPSLGRYCNNKKCYGDLCDLVTRMRLEETIPFECIADETRVTDCNYGFDCVSTFVSQEIKTMLGGYHRDLLQSQSVHVEMIVEKLNDFQLSQTHRTGIQDSDYCVSWQ